MQHRILQLLFLFSCLAPVGYASTGWGGDQQTAPDGHRGFGAEADPGELLKQFRTPTKEDDAFFAELESLGRDVGVLVDVTEGFYRERGLFELLDPTLDQSLEVLHATYERYERDPSVVANRPLRIGRAFARMFLDTRFRVRHHLIAGWAREADEIRRGLAVLRAAAHGYVILDGSQAQNVVTRIDLSAAMLRSIHSDLESLREPLESPQDSTVSEEEVEQFLALFNIGDRDLRERSQAAAFEAAAKSEERMRAVLFTERLREEGADYFAWRLQADAEARSLLAQALEADPDSEEEDVPREISKLSKSKRRKLSRQKALEGLALDPLDEELAWAAGVMSSFVYGELETASHYDRFLILRGISYRVDSSYSDRELTARERHALKYVQDIDRRVQDGTGQ